MFPSGLGLMSRSCALDVSFEVRPHVTFMRSDSGALLPWLKQLKVSSWHKHDALLCLLTFVTACFGLCMSGLQCDAEREVDAKHYADTTWAAILVEKSLLLVLC
jgi:hypothetical protein